MMCTNIYIGCMWMCFVSGIFRILWMMIMGKRGFCEYCRWQNYCVRVGVRVCSRVYDKKMN